MNETLVNSIYEFIDIFNNNSDVIEYKQLREKILNNPKILDDFNKIKELNKNDIEYKNKKYELFDNDDVSTYLKLENQINYNIMYLNMQLKELMDKKKCI